MLDNRKSIIDEDLMLFASANLSTGSYCTYGAATPKTIDLGEGYTEGKLWVNVTAKGATGFSTTASGTMYAWVIRGSNRSSFDSGCVPLGQLRIGAPTTVQDSIRFSGLFGASSGSPTTGLYQIPFNNDYGGTVYRYLRVRFMIGGSAGTTPTWEAWISKY